MAVFAYKARDGRGMLTTGSLQALSLEEASRVLRGEGKFVVELAPAQEKKSSAVRRPAGRIRREEVITFAHQLAVMVDTGVPLKEALECAVTQAQNPAFRAVLEDVTAHVQAGNEFSSALQRHPRVFPDVMICLLRASEVSGAMGPMLDRIARYLAKEHQTRKRIRSALSYPLFMLVMAIAVVVFLLVGVLPRFAAIYEHRGASLPGPTRVLLAISDITVEYWWLWSGTIAVMGIFGYLFAHTTTGRRVIDALKLRLPVIGTIFSQLYITRSCRTMGAMLNAGVAMLDMIAIVRQGTHNVHFQDMWDMVDDRLRKGSQLSEPLFDSPLIPRAVAQMIHSGEKSGRLGTVMNRIADYTEQEFDNSVRNATQFIEPVMVGFMGGLIGFIAIPLLLPIFNVGQVMTS